VKLLPPATYQQRPAVLLSSVPDQDQMLAPLHVVDDPEPGRQVTCAVASCLEVRLPAAVSGHWRIEERPSYLVPISQGADHFTFVVLESLRDEPPLRLVRAHPFRGDVEERSVVVRTG